MTRPARPDPGAQREHARRVRDEEGSISLFVAVLAVAVFGVAGLVYDGGMKLDAGRRADSLAQEAARAGAEQVGLANAPGASGGLGLNGPQAAAAAEGYLAQAGVPGTVTLTGPNTLEVTVTITQKTALLDLLGVDSTTVTGHASAQLVHGITREEP